jgi:hypothetical protein
MTVTTSTIDETIVVTIDRPPVNAVDGIVFLSENENRAERLGSVLYSLDPSLDVLVFPRLNTLPFDA